MSCGVGGRCGSDTQLLWLWHRLAAAAPIQPLAWEPLYAMGAALKKTKDQKKKKKKKKKKALQNPEPYVLSKLIHSVIHSLSRYLSSIYYVLELFDWIFITAVGILLVLQMGKQAQRRG